MWPSIIVSSAYDMLYADGCFAFICVEMQLVNAYLHPTLQLLLYIRLQLSVSLMVITDVDAYTPVLQ